MNRPRLPIHPPIPMPMPAPAHLTGHHPNNFARPPPLPAQYGQPSPPVLPPLTPTDVRANTSESPISAYMRYLQNSIVDPGFRQPQYQHNLQPHVPGQNLA
ncbi:vq domain-containing protein [Abeliophyllum distichum]|uniref:Vq domain-containing protein n=1 Tax=Abeliophyllum distichum TaxID=126358 RepID=A0ABD1QYH4_9LAMI